MKIIVNDKPFTSVTAPLSVARLLKEAGVETPDMVSVQVNGQFLGKEEFATVILKEGDAVDFLYFMGGGAY